MNDWGKVGFVIIAGVISVFFLILLFFLKILLRHERNQIQTSVESNLLNVPHVGYGRLFVFLVLEGIFYLVCLDLPLIFRDSGILMVNLYALMFYITSYVLFIIFTFLLSKYFLFSKLKFSLWPARFKIAVFICVALPLLSLFM